jgi:hypothetical protein
MLSIARHLKNGPHTDYRRQSQISEKMGVDSSTKSDLFCQTQFDGFLDSTQMEKMLKIDSPCAFNLSAFLFSN